jgi:hypothetical protein
MSAVLLVAAASLPAACESPRRPAPARPSEPAPARPSWRELALPAASGRARISAVVACVGRWYAVGAVTDARGDRPAAWTGTPEGPWRALTVRPLSFYGARHVLYDAACAGDRLVALGAAPGGAHGNPRTATWLLAPPDTGTLREVDAAFETYGGPEAVAVSAVAGGPRGFVVGGARAPGGSMSAAAWHSADGERFALAGRSAWSPARAGLSFAGAAVAAPDGSWLLLGWLLGGASGGGRDPAAWHSVDGARWSAETLPADRGADDSVHRGVGWRGGVLGVGVHGARFGVWWRDGAARWDALAAFGAVTGGRPAAVTAVTTAGGALYAAACDGATYRLWRSGDARHWSELSPPRATDCTPGHTVVATAHAGRLLVAVDDGTRVSLHVTDAG